MNLLLVTTSPDAIQANNQQSVLWAFNICPGLPIPELLFAVSLGVGGQGYAPTVDCRDGMILVGRLTNSLLLVDASLAFSGWNQDISGTIGLVGNNQSAIIQPFWIDDPCYIWTDVSGNETMSSAVHWGVGLLPTAAQANAGSVFQCVVGFTDPLGQWRGQALTGIPGVSIPYTAGANYFPSDPFSADPASEAIAQIKDGPPADVRVLPGPISSFWDTKKYGICRIAVVPNITITPSGGAPRETNLVVGVSEMQPMLDSGPKAGGGFPLGNSLVILEKNGGVLPTELGIWPTVPPFGPGVPYQIQNHIQPSVDAFLGLVAVSVMNSNTSQISWFVLDISQPATPKVVAKITDNVGRFAALSNGTLFSVATDGTAHANQVVVGQQNIDQIDCSISISNCDNYNPIQYPNVDPSVPPAVKLINSIIANYHGEKKQILIFVWNAVISPFSVGHVAATAEVTPGNWEIILSQFPEPHGMIGQNKIITDPLQLIIGEGGGVSPRYPEHAYLVDINDYAAFCKQVIIELLAQAWTFFPAWDCNHTHCTVAVVRSLNASNTAIPLTFSIVPTLFAIPFDDAINSNMKGPIHDGTALIHNVFP